MNADRSPLPSLSDITGWRDAAVQVAFAAGAMLQDIQGRIEPNAIISKSAAVDLVSNADKDAEALIRAGLQQILPEAGFIGEESPLPDMSEHAFYWCVDPLDGTSNFLCGLPIWAVSIALVTPQIQPLLGVVHAPLLQRTWSGAQGCGATCNGKLIAVRTEPPGGGLHNSMLATGFPYDVTTANDNTNIDLYSIMQRQFQKIRRLGSAALDLSYVADGTFDGMWELKLKPWDSAAGVLLVTEAGGLVCNLQGEPYTPGDISVVAASNAQLLERILSLIGTRA